MNELGNSPPFVLSCFLFASGGKGQKVILNIWKIKKNVANSVDANKIHKFCIKF